MNTKTLDTFLVVGINYTNPNTPVQSKSYFDDVDQAYEFARSFTEWTIYNRYKGTESAKGAGIFYIEDSNCWENHI